MAQRGFVCANDAFQGLLPEGTSAESLLKNWKKLAIQLQTLDKEADWNEYLPAFSDYLSLHLARLEENLAELFVTPSFSFDQRKIEDSLHFGVIRYYRPEDDSKALPIYINPAAKKILSSGLGMAEEELGKLLPFAAIDQPDVVRETSVFNGQLDPVSFHIRLAAKDPASPLILEGDAT